MVGSKAAVDSRSCDVDGFMMKAQWNAKTQPVNEWKLCRKKADVALQ